MYWLYPANKGDIAMMPQNCSIKPFLNEQAFIYVQIRCSEKDEEELAVEFIRVLPEILDSCNMT